jgi:deoxycytidylate deaminase
VQSGIEKIYYIHDYKNDENLKQQLDIHVPILQLKMPDETT